MMTSSPSLVRAEVPVRCQPSTVPTAAVQRENNAYHKRSHSPPLQTKGGYSQKGLGLIGKGPPPLCPNMVAVDPDSRHGRGRHGRMYPHTVVGGAGGSAHFHPQPSDMTMERQNVYWVGRSSLVHFGSAREQRWQMQRQPSTRTTLEWGISCTKSSRRGRRRRSANSDCAVGTTWRLLSIWSGRRGRLWNMEWNMYGRPEDELFRRALVRGPSLELFAFFVRTSRSRA